MQAALKYLEIPALIAVPLALAACAFLRLEHNALLSLIVVVAALVVFFAHYEVSRPSLRQIMPTVVMGALAAAGRILFAPVPDFKPVTAICIVSGVVFGRHAGFITGALAALISNFFFGQGPWTPWQMYAWGMTGYFAGVLASAGLFGTVHDRDQKETPNTQTRRNAFRQVGVLIYGAIAAFLFGFLMNTWTIVGFIQPLTWQSALITYAASLPLDAVHAAATVVFLAAIYTPWQKKLQRIKCKYALKTR